MQKVKRALISVTDKKGILEFAQALQKHGVEIISTGGTAAALRKAAVAVTEVSDYTGFPEILDGRLKTLHPKIHGGLLGLRGNPKHVEQMSANKILPIDLLIVNLYRFEETVASKGVTLDEAIENIDIGGPAMLRAAAKNWQHVACIIDPSDYDLIIREMDEKDGVISRETKFHLAKKVFAATARYDAAIATWLGGYNDDGKKLEMPEVFCAAFELMQPLRYGENPHQKASFYRDSVLPAEPCIANIKQFQGKELSFNNIMDADAAIEIVKEFTDAKFAAVIVKHANPCGAAISKISLEDAYKNAFECDPLSAFGGILGFNKTVDEKTAKAIADTFYEIIAAPKFESSALRVFTTKKNLRILEVPGLGKRFVPAGWNLRKVVGGILVQGRDVSCESVRDAKVVTKRAPTDEEWRSLEFAWRICKHVKSNAIVYAKDGHTIGIGCGQTSRVDSAKLAVMKARQSIKGSVMASDAFFPFRDSIDAAAEAGATAVVQPGGSMRDNEVIAAADEHKMAMVFTGIRHFKH